MADFKAAKVVAALPATLEADTVYFIRSGAGFDLKVTNGVGEVVALPLNPSPVPASPWVAVPLEDTVEIPVGYNFMYRTFADMVQIAGTFKTVGALSEGSLIGNMPAGLFPAEGLVVTGKGYYLGEDGQIKSSAAVGEGEIVHTGVVSYPLAMPEPERLQGNMLTIGTWGERPNTWGWFQIPPWENNTWVGEFEPRQIEDLVVAGIEWETSSQAGQQRYSIRFDLDEGLTKLGKYRVTIGTWQGVLWGNTWSLDWNNYGYQPELPAMTESDFNALPKSGTHLVTVEYIGT